jgi:hypothetical protein
MFSWRVICGLIALWVSINNLYAYPSSLKVSGDFHTVFARGDISVTIHQTSGPSYAIAHGDSQDLIYLEFETKQDCLKINLGRGFPHFSNVSIDIWVNNLHRLVQRQNAKITGHQLYSSGLIVSAVGNVPLCLDGNINLTGLQAKKNAHVEIAGINSKSLSIDLHHKAYAKLQGVIRVCRINVYDESWLSMYWVKANRMSISYGEHGFVQLAGLTNVLDLELYDHAKFAGRYLRANRAFVRTHDFSLAQISAVRSQHTLALDRSHIDFFNLPLMRTDFMTEHGAVLDLREWTLPYAQEEVKFGDENG